MRWLAPVVAIATILAIAAPTVTSLSLADPSASRSMNRQVDFKGGAGVGRLVFTDDDTPVDKWECKYDMVLVERIQGRPKTESGLFVPRENLPRLHLCRGTYLLIVSVNLR